MNGVGLVFLRTERLTLREFTPADERAVHSYAADPAVTRFVAWGPNTAGDTREFITNAIATSKTRPRTDFDLAVVHTDTQTLIGGAALRVTESEMREGEIGYVVHRDHWSRGYATEVAEALLQFAFSELGLQRVSATCDPENHASARVLEKVGMIMERRLTGHLLVRGSLRDSLLFGCSAERAT